MDIDLLSKMVKELILDNDKVVLPGLGSFVAEVVPSTFSDKGYTINPPYRRLYFRSKPDEGSELAEFYAASNKVDAEMAKKVIVDFVAELKTILLTRKTVIFPGLGRLRATRENAVFFVADEDLDIYPEGFGLEPVSLKTHQETKEEVAAAVVELKSLLEETSAAEEIPEEEPVTPEPVAEPAEAPVVETAAESVTEPVEEPAPEPIAEPAIDNVGCSGRKVWKKAAVVLLAVACVLLAALAVVGRLYPEFVDTFLFTPEELNILNHTL